MPTDLRPVFNKRNYQGENIAGIPGKGILYADNLGKPQDSRLLKEDSNPGHSHGIFKADMILSRQQFSIVYLSRVIWRISKTKDDGHGDEESTTRDDDEDDDYDAPVGEEKIDENIEDLT
ncbi:hypothetical protein ACLMJK_000050 [Lecanora helva]